MGGLDKFSSNLSPKEIIRIGAALLVSLLIIIAVIFMFSNRDSDNTQTEGTEQETQTQTESESDDFEIATSSDATPSDLDEFDKFVESEEGLSDDIIRELQKKQQEEGVDPNIQADAWEQGLKGQITQGQAEESQQDSEVQETQDSSIETNPAGEEYEHQFNNKGEMEHVMDDDGRLEENIADRVEDAYVPGSGPLIGQNDSVNLNMRKTVIKNLYTTGSGDRLGDTVMFGDLAVKIGYLISEPGYYVSTTGDTATLDFKDRGVVLITKVTDFNPTDLSIANLMELGGITEVDESAVERPIGGSYTNKSYVITSKDYTRGIYYYSCPVGTYQFLFIGTPQNPAVTLTLNVTPDESINAIPGDDIQFEVSE